MKFLRRLVVPLLLVFAGSMYAQTTPSPKPSPPQTPNAQTNAIVPTPSPSATAAIEPPSLIPPNILPAPNTLPAVPNAPELELLNSFFKSTSLGKAADEHRLHVQTVALEARIRNDQDLHKIKASAARAPTDLERRHQLKAYYDLYYKKLRAMAETPDLKSYLDEQEAAHKLTLLQPRVRHQTDEAEATNLAKISAGAPATPQPSPPQARAGEKVHP